MTQEWTLKQKDSLLQELLQHLSARGVAIKWATSKAPYSDVQRECRTLMEDQSFKVAIRDYLNANQIIEQTVETLLASLAMTSNVKWQDTPPIVQPLSRRCWYLARWVPTFLIIDGPLGRILKNPDSPLNSILRQQHAVYPILCQVRDVFNSNLFRQVRNGVGHWSFLWDEKDSNPHIVVIEILDTEIFKRVNPKLNSDS